MCTPKQGDVCGFCKRGAEAEDVCGKLHMDRTTENKVVAAHHKCMQYSALLTQYKFEHFGGFKIDKVLTEMQRGRNLKCTLCSKKKTRKGEPASKSGAVSGCAVKKCHKTFHYYCAVGDENVVTKRLVVNFKHKAKKAVLYRVFCSEDHKQQYLVELKSEKERESLLNVGDESDVSDEDEDADVPDRSRPHEGSSSQRDELYLDHDTSFIQLATPQLLSSQPQPNIICLNTSANKPGPHQSSPSTIKLIPLPFVKVAKADQVTLNGNGRLSDSVGEQSPPDLRISSDHSYVKTSDQRPSPEKIAQKTKLEPPKNRQTSEKHIKVQSPNSHSPVKFSVTKDLSPFVRLALDVDSNGNRTPSNPPVKPSSPVQVPSTKCPFPYAHNRDTSSSPGRQVAPLTVVQANIQPRAEDHPPPVNDADQLPSNAVALCILGTVDCDEEMDMKMRHLVCTRYKISSDSVHLWQHVVKEHGLADPHMPHFMSDLAEKLQHGETEVLLQSLVTPRTSGLLEKYENIVEFQEKLETPIRSQLEEGVKKQTSKIMKRTGKNLDTKVGGLYRMDDNFVLVLLLNDITDPVKDLRAIFPVMSNPGGYGSLYPWNLDCDVRVTDLAWQSNSDMLATHVKEEVGCIKRWLITQLSGESHTIVRPKERDILSVPNLNRTSVAVNINDFLHRTFPPMSVSPDSRVLCLTKVDTAVVNHREYLHRVLVQFLLKPSPSSVHLCVLDIGNYDTKTLREDIQRTEKVTGCTLDLFTTADPSSSPAVLSVVIKATKTPRPLADNHDKQKASTLHELSPQRSSPQTITPRRSSPRSTPQKSTSLRSKANGGSLPMPNLDAKNTDKPNKKSSDSDDSLRDFNHSFTPRILIPGSAKRKYVEDGEMPSTSKMTRRRLPDRSEEIQKSKRPGSEGSRRRSIRIK